MPKNSAPTTSGGFAGPFRVHGSSGVSSKDRPKDVQIDMTRPIPVTKTEGPSGDLK